MYLSTLLINVGDNPDRPRPGRLWLRNLYRVHQRLCMAFPSKGRVEKDEQFLQPYDPGEFAQGHIHVNRNPDAGFLFRIDPQPGGRTVILVLSAIKPDWDYAFQNALHLLAAPPTEPRPLELPIENGNQFRFHLLANPTKRAPMTKKERLAKMAVNEKTKRPRLQLTWKSEEDSNEVFKKWMDSKGKSGGFKLIRTDVTRIGFAYFNKSNQAGKSQRLRSVRYEGLLEVTDSEQFHKTLASGIGPAKAFGFGLLSLARPNEP